MEDIDDPNDHHRHTSHLFGVFPGRQFTLAKTPDMLRAAKVSLVARTDGGDVREWSFAWRTALYARMHDGEDAHREFDQLFSDRNTCLNLCSACIRRCRWTATSASRQESPRCCCKAMRARSTYAARSAGGLGKRLRHPACGRAAASPSASAGQAASCNRPRWFPAWAAPAAVRVGQQTRTLPTKSGGTYTLDGDLKTAR